MPEPTPADREAAGAWAAAQYDSGADESNLPTDCFLAGALYARELAAKVAESPQLADAHGGRATAWEIAAAIRRGPQ